MFHKVTSQVFSVQDKSELVRTIPYASISSVHLMSQWATILLRPPRGVHVYVYWKQKGPESKGSKRSHNHPATHSPFHLVGSTNTPYFGWHLKYLTPAFEPSFLPQAWSNSIPNQNLRDNVININIIINLLG